jgi:predicted DCC family thiol-disulfide oxidoreductase YuxK
MLKHLVFYDGKCGLCDHAVQFVLKHDMQEDFAFAPLQGKTAHNLLQFVPQEDSLVLIENYQTEDRKIYQLGTGAFRILWLLGGSFRLIGWPFFLPSFLYNWGYRLVARHRHQFFSQDTCPLPDPKLKDRFLS